MKTGIHPNYVECTITCACGNVVKTRATVPAIRLDICGACHPFFTGQEKLVDTAGRVERFRKRYAEKPKKKTDEEEGAEAAEAGN
jgi:large subunit ribosomal protein L31